MYFPRIHSTDHKCYWCLDLTTNNIVISRHIVLYEADFLFSASPHLTNNLDIFLQDDSPGMTPIPTLLAALRVPLGFPTLVTTSGQTARPGCHTVLRTEAGG
jgi:hypothetical protein